MKAHAVTDYNSTDLSRHEAVLATSFWLTKETFGTGSLNKADSDRRSSLPLKRR